VEIDIATGARTSLLSGEELGVVLAATWSSAERVLYVLDEVPGAWLRPRRARLVRLDPQRDTIEVVGSWVRTGWSRRFVMATAADGSLWLAASADAGMHVVAWLDPQGARLLRGAKLGLGALASEMGRASRFGFSFAVQSPGDPRLIGVRHAELSLRAPRDLERCF
jgi:hypothetical protein